MQKITTKIVTKRNWNDHARTNPGARPPTTQKQRPKQQPREQRKRQPKQQQKRKPNDHARIQPLSRHRTATKIAPEKRTKTTRNTATKAARKTGITMTTPTLVRATTPPSWIKPLSWGPKMRSEKRTRGWPFSASRCEKTGNVDLKMGPKIWTPFWGPRKENTIRRTPKRGPDFAPHFGVHIAHVFRSMTPEKITCCVEYLWAGSLSWQPHVLALGRTVLRGLVWYAFLTPFWSRKNIFFSKETMLKPMSDLSQIQDEPSKSLD